MVTCGAEPDSYDWKRESLESDDVKGICVLCSVSEETFVLALDGVTSSEKVNHYHGLFWKETW